MNISDIGVIFAISGSLLTGGGTILLHEADQRYILVAETVKTKILDYQERIFLLEQGTVDDDEKEQIEFYEHQIEQLERGLN